MLRLTRGGVMISYQNGADKMKKLLSILLAALFAASVFTSCSSDDDGDKFESGWYWVTEDVAYDGGDRGKYYCLISFDKNGNIDESYDYYGKCDLYDYYTENSEKKGTFNIPETIPLKKRYYKDNNDYDWEEITYQELKSYVDNKKTYRAEKDCDILLCDLKKASERKYIWEDGTSAGSSDSDENQSQATAEQLKKFEPGWWWIFETLREVDYNSNNEESFYYCCYLIKYGSDYEHTGKYFAEPKSGWSGDKENLVCTQSLDDEKCEWINDYNPEESYDASWFPPINYKEVSKYIEKEFGRPDKDDGYLYTTYILKKASSEDENFPNWATKE